MRRNHDGPSREVDPLVALGLTVALSAFIIVSLALVLIGPDAARRVAGWVGAAPVAVLLWCYCDG